MRKQGKLEYLETTPPTRFFLIWSKIVGFVSYGIGLIMIILILYSTIRQLHYAAGPAAAP